MPNVDELIDGVNQIVTDKKEGTLYFTVLDLKHAYSQSKLAVDTARQCNFNIVGETLQEHIVSSYSFIVWLTHGLRFKKPWTERSTMQKHILFPRRYPHCVKSN